jgi:hypothetical protein
MFAVIWTPSANGDLAVIAFSHADRLVEIVEVTVHGALWIG